MSSVAQRLGAFVAGLDEASIPADVLEKARLDLVHNLSVAVAGGLLAEVAERWTQNRWGGSGARALVSGQSLTPPDAAFANACLMHARTQDDVFFPGVTHVGSATIPAVLALGEAVGATLGQAVVALIAGFETAAAISAVAPSVSTALGFRASGIYGVFGSTAAAAKLLDLDAEQTAHALAIATSFSAGTGQTWVDGSLEYEFQLGAAARSGLEAAVLAKNGGTGSVDAFEGAFGFFAAFMHDASAALRAVDGLGEVWRTRDVTFKPFPVCAILQSPVEAAVELRERNPGRELAHAGIRLTPSEAHYPGTDGIAPFDDASAALMSASYCLALGLGQGGATAGDLFRSHEPELIDLSRRIEVISDDSLSARSFVLDVEFTDGGTDRVTRDGNSSYNWDRAELAANVDRLKVEVPAGIDLDRLQELCYSDSSTPISAIVDTLVASGTARS